MGWFSPGAAPFEEYDGDYLNAMYVTPHSWTQFAEEVKERRVVQSDQRKWDYRHQVLEQKHLKPWQLFFAVKWLEVRFHLQPRKARKFLQEHNTFRRRQQWWALRHTGAVWLMEIADFLFKTRFERQPQALAQTLRPVAPTQSQKVAFNASRPLR